MKAMDYALKLIKIRLRSENELRDRLLKKGYAEDDINLVVSQLEQVGLVDDEQFARLWVRSQNNLKPSGEYLLRMRLKEFGIQKEIVEKILEENKEEFSEISKAKRVVESKSRLYAKIENKYERKQKILALLQRRGFSYSVAKQAVEAEGEV